MKPVGITVRSRSGQEERAVLSCTGGAINLCELSFEKNKVIPLVIGGVVVSAEAITWVFLSAATLGFFANDQAIRNRLLGQVGILEKLHALLRLNREQFLRALQGPTGASASRSQSGTTRNPRASADPQLEALNRIFAIQTHQENVECWVGYAQGFEYQVRSWALQIPNWIGGDPEGQPGLNAVKNALKTCHVVNSS